MTTLQSIVYAILGSIFEFIPVSADAMYRLTSESLEWALPMPPLRGVIQAGLFLALLVHFRHDFLSMFSSFLQVLVYRRKPKAIDEKLPFMLLISVGVSGLLGFLLRDQLNTLSPLVFLLLFALIGLPLWFAESRSKRSKNHYDWNALDATLLGLGSACFLIPAIGRTAGAYFISTVRNYSKEGATKFILFTATPMMGAAAYWNLSGINFHSLNPLDGMTWLSFYVSGAVAFVFGFLAIRSVQEKMRTTTLGRYAFLRMIFALLFVAALAVRGQLFSWISG